MILFPPASAHGRIGSVLSALIIVSCLIGLTVHKDVYAHRIRRDFYCYYTNLSNLLVLIYFSLGAPLLYAHTALHRLLPVTEFSITMSILLTHLVFHFMIFPVIRRQGRLLIRSRAMHILAVDNLFIHYLVPWLTTLYWLLCSPNKHQLSLPASLLWMILPVLYVTFIFIRAGRRGAISGTQSAYPYPFLDADAIGVRRTLLNCSALCAAGVLTSLGLVLLMRMLYAIFGAQNMLFLV